MPGGFQGQDGPAIEIKGLGKTYLDFWRRPTVEALKGLDLSVGRGDVFGLLGPNGSGKSTTIKLVLGLVTPTSGSVKVFGRDPSSTDVKRRLGYLPELTNLHRFLTPRETLRYYAGIFGLDDATARRRIGELLEMVGLAKAADREIGGFSKGMARRVGVAQALINNPDLIILDEPTSGLDPVGSNSVKEWIGELAKAGKTVFMTSHLLADVEDVATHVAILCGGEKRADGDIGELLPGRGAARGAVRLESFFLDVVKGEKTPPLAPFLLEPRDRQG